MAINVLTHVVTRLLTYVQFIHTFMLYTLTNTHIHIRSRRQTHKDAF